jgi:hypothetical protein
VILNPMSFSNQSHACSWCSSLSATAGCKCPEQGCEKEDCPMKMGSALDKSYREVYGFPEFEEIA